MGQKELWKLVGPGKVAILLVFPSGYLALRVFRVITRRIVTTIPCLSLSERQMHKSEPTAMAASPQLLYYFRDVNTNWMRLK